MRHQLEWWSSWCWESPDPFTSSVRGPHSDIRVVVGSSNPMTGREMPYSPGILLLTEIASPSRTHSSLKRACLMVEPWDSILNV